MCVYMRLHALYRECCRSIRIGKILIQSTDDESRKSSVVYAKFPSDISMRKILLMYPITSSFQSPPEDSIEIIKH